MEVILDTRNQLTFLEKDVILMGFGKRVCELLAVIASLLLIGALVWYLSSGFGDRGYEKEGTLVWEGDGRAFRGRGSMSGLCD